MKKVCILGRGPSLEAFKKADIDDVTDVLLLNNHVSTIADPASRAKLEGKKLHIMCNISQTGFVAGALEKIEITTCITNRFKPDWELWQQYKDAQRKHHEGGHLNNLGYLPPLAEDEPYLYAWRGPKGRNTNNMQTYDGRPIEHMPEEAEKYVIPIYQQKLVCNCAYYGTLYALLKLNADYIIYYGLDFYDNLSLKKEWYGNPPPYLSSEWWNLRVKYEGEHMKFMWDNFLCLDFPERIFEINTTADLAVKSSNIIYNKVTSEKSKSTYY